MEEASQQDVKQQQQQQQQGITPRSAGTGSGGAGKRTLPPQQHLSPFSSPPAAHDAFLSKLEEAEIRDEVISQVLSGKSDASFLTPVRSTLRTPQPYQQTGGAPGAPSSNKGRAHSRTEQAREFLGNVASGARRHLLRRRVEGPRRRRESRPRACAAMSPLGKHSANKATRRLRRLCSSRLRLCPLNSGTSLCSLRTRSRWRRSRSPSPKLAEGCQAQCGQEGRGWRQGEASEQGPAREAGHWRQQAAKQAGGAAAPRASSALEQAQGFLGEEEERLHLAGKPPNGAQLELGGRSSGKRVSTMASASADSAAAGGKPGGGGKKRGRSALGSTRYITQGPDCGGRLLDNRAREDYWQRTRSRRQVVGQRQV